MEPDGLQRLWTPHRMAYINREEGEGLADSGGAAAADDVAAAAPACPFCRIPTLTDEDGLVVARGTLVFAVLNLYPYNAGHLMVVPYRHIADYTDTTDAEAAEMAGMTRHAMTTIRAVSAPDGFNIGINQGAAGGAGIAAHLHRHVVPRWVGDANFMAIVGATRVLPQILADTRRLLAQAW